MKLGYKKNPELITVGQKDPNYIVAETLDLGVYDDLSTIVGWYNSDVLDWSRRRDYIKPLFYAKAGADLSNYATLTAEEKLIGTKCFLIPLALRLTNWSEEEDIEGWNNLMAERKITRSKCIEQMRLAVAEKIRIGELSLTQTQEFDKDSSQMIAWYERSDAQDFKQWLTNEVGSPYELAGFAQKTYYSVGLKDQLLAIYNGAF